MRNFWIGASIALFIVAAGYLFLRFGFSDYTEFDREVHDLKPWRPYSRLIFGAVCVSILLLFAGLFCRSLFRK